MKDDDRSSASRKFDDGWRESLDENPIQTREESTERLRVDKQLGNLVPNLRNKILNLEKKR